MRSERGQATVEWTALVLLVALALVAAGRLAPRADGSELGASLAHAVTHVGSRARPDVSSRPRPVPAPRPRDLPPQNRPGALARKAWFACLVYQRVRYSLRHPVSRLPGYTFPYRVALRIAKRCLNPLDLLREIPALNPLG
jgi:Flp pilus assembly pilin Flp